MSLSTFCTDEKHVDDAKCSDCNGMMKIYYIGVQKVLFIHILQNPKREQCHTSTWDEKVRQMQYFVVCISSWNKIIDIVKYHSDSVAFCHS